MFNDKTHTLQAEKKTFVVYFVLNELKWTVASHDTKLKKLFSHLLKLEVISYLFIKQGFLLAEVWMTLINGGRTNTLSANVHGAVNW